MKYIFSLVFATLLFSTCTTDFQLEAEWADTPIVYGFISLQDTAHYIRLEKAFLEPGGNANDIAQIADSLYYENATVQIKNLETGDTYDFYRVDGNLEGYQREEGTFAAAPNYLYKIKADEINLNGGDEIELIINTGEGNDLVTAKTIVLEEMILKESSLSTPLRLYGYDKKLAVKWTNGVEAKIFDYRWVIHYKESITGSTDFEEKTLHWTIDDRITFEVERIEGSGIFKVEEFYKFMANNIEENSEVSRSEVRIDFRIVGGGNEFLDYLRISNANLGITSANQVPVYTNMSRGLGIFASRSSLEKFNFSIDLPSRDSLAEGIYTKHLNF